jgi:hypothetical protein
VVDDLDGDLAGGGAGEGLAGGGVEGRPGGCVDVGAQGALELFVGLVDADEVGVADEEALAVVECDICRGVLGSYAASPISMVTQYALL